MRKKIKEIVMRWHEIAAPNAHLTFDHELKGQKKKFRARIDADDAGNPSLSIISLQGYNEAYVKRKINHIFNELTASFDVGLQTGDVIHTAFSVNNPPTPGTKVTLPASTNYYAVNDGRLSCDGNELGKSYQCIFVGRVNDHCRPDAEPAFYTKFKLL